MVVVTKRFWKGARAMVGERIDFDAIEALGHNLTLVAPMHAGRSCYSCENCGTFVIVVTDIIAVWHHSRHDRYCCEPAITGRRTLYDKLRTLELETLERLVNV
jgi:hypothetical protein